LVSVGTLINRLVLQCTNTTLDVVSSTIENTFIAKIKLENGSSVATKLRH
jgi:hypothetical protein